MTVFYTAHITPPCLFAIGSTQWGSAYTPNCLESLPLNFKLTCPDFCRELFWKLKETLGSCCIYGTSHTSCKDGKVLFEHGNVQYLLQWHCCHGIILYLNENDKNSFSSETSWGKWAERCIRRHSHSSLGVVEVAWNVTSKKAPYSDTEFTECCKIWGKSAASRLIAKAWILSSSALRSRAERGTWGVSSDACQHTMAAACQHGCLLLTPVRQATAMLLH